MDARGAARFLFFLHISFFHFLYHRSLLLSLSLTFSLSLYRSPFSHPLSCPLRARHYGHPESTGTMEYKAKGEAERESQKRGNRRQVILRRKLVSVVQARTPLRAEAKDDDHSGKGYARMGQPSRGPPRLRKRGWEMHSTSRVGARRSSKCTVTFIPSTALQLFSWGKKRNQKIISQLLATLAVFSGHNSCVQLLKSTCFRHFREELSDASCTIVLSNPSP